MSNTIWQTPAPSSGFVRGVNIQLRARREVVLTFSYEDSDGDVRCYELVFGNVVHYRVTYLAALLAEEIRDAYDRVVDVGASPELLGVVSAMRANGRSSEVRHYRVCFDDGPCFDIVAGGFEPRAF